MTLIGNHHFFSHRFLKSLKSLCSLGLMVLLVSCGGGGSKDRTPDAFSFETQTDVALNTALESNPQTITSISNGTSISIGGGEYSIAGGAFTSAAGTISNNQSVVVRVLSSANNATTTTATLTIGNVSGAFSVTTLLDNTPDAFTFADVVDVALSTEVQSAPIVVTGLAAAAEISVTGGEYSLDDGATFSDAVGSVSDGQSVIVKQTSSATNSTTTNTVLTIGGVSDTFSVTTLADNIPAPFSFDSQTDVLRDSVVVSNEITVSDIEVAVDISIVGGEYSINGGDFTSNAGTVTNDQLVRVRTTSGSSVNEEISATLTISNVETVFSVTTHTADANGIFNGSGTVNSGTNLADVKGIIRNERFMLFNEAENVLYDGQIQSYAGDTFVATVDVYKDGVNSLQVDATGSAANQSLITLTLSGTGYGSGTLSLTYDVLYERDATFDRFFTPFPLTWGGQTNTVNNGQPFSIFVPDDESFEGGPAGVNQCSYSEGTKNIPDSSVNLYNISFNSEHTGPISSCDHVGTGYLGMVTIVDGGTRGTDGVMWFVATNGVNSSFTVLVYNP